MSYSLHVLTKDIFEKNPNFYEESLNEIYDSNKLPYLEDWSAIYSHQPVISLVFLKENEKIVSFMYSTPHKDFEGYEASSLTHWGINFIQTHNDFKRKGYGYLTALLGFKDIISKGGKEVDFFPICSESKHLFHKIVNPYKVGYILPTPGCSTMFTIYFHENFLFCANVMKPSELIKFIQY